MKSVTSGKFRDAYRRMPEPARRQARKAHRQFLLDPTYPGLCFKKVGEPNVYSARAGIGYRAIGWLEGDTVTWLWIGPHAEYDRLI